MNRNWPDFISLYGNIEGARAAFEDACETLFRKKYHTKHVSKVKVKKGDSGIDIFVGELGIEPITVLQCKFFLDTIGDSQKQQIRESFNTAISSEKKEGTFVPSVHSSFNSRSARTLYNKTLKDYTTELSKEKNNLIATKKRNLLLRKEDYHNQLT